MIEGPDGNDGTIARNGVCDRCHTEAEPYWRVAKTLPPAPGTNDFSGDGNAVALWSVDNGALTTDSIGTNTLTDNNTVGTDTVDYQVGNASADFEISNSESLTITDANLDSGFPLKSSDSATGDISVTFWYKKESGVAYGGLFSKWDTGNNARSFYLRDYAGSLDFYIGTGAPDFSTIVPNRMFRNNNGKDFEEVTAAGNFVHIQKGHGVAFADIDQAGD